MLKGYLDGITSSGYIEGWAFDTDSPLDPLAIALVDDAEQEVAWGLAHRFREDLVAAGCAAGWCAFRVKANQSVATLRGSALALIDRATGAQIIRIVTLSYTEDVEPLLSTVAEAVAADPTILLGLHELRGCEEIFSAFLKARGVEAFIRAAYGYVLGRPADASGLASYGKLIRKSSLTPMQMLTSLTDGEEFRSRSRLLAAPNTRAFPFR